MKKLYLTMSLTKKFSKNVFRKVVTKVIFLLGSLTRKFITFHTRPIFASDIKYRGKETAEDALCAIIIQGPIRREDNFTLETVKLYRKHYPAATVILSTWEDEDISTFKTLEDKRSKIVRGKKPSYNGPGNVNMQAGSTKNGIALAVQMGLRYVLKTRTDQRMYGIGTLQFFINLLEQFPIRDGSTQKKRIVGFNVTTTTRYLPYHLSDLFMFGATEDMKTYWDIPLIMDKTDKRGPIVERRLFMGFLRNTGWDGKDTEEDFLRALGERCVVVGNESVDLYWPKYFDRRREHRILDYQYPTFEISFKKWLNKAYMPTVGKR